MFANDVDDAYAAFMKYGHTKFWNNYKAFTERNKMNEDAGFRTFVQNHKKEIDQMYKGRSDAAYRDYM